MLICSIIPPIIIINLTNLKKLLTYSSINQLGWILILIYLKNIIWLSYLTIYTLISILIFSILTHYKIYNNFIELFPNNLIILLIILNIASMPPFSFFIFKWLRIFVLIINSNIFPISLIIIIRSFIIFFIYLNIIYLSIFTNLTKSKLLNPITPIINYNHLNIFILIITLISFPLIFII